MRSHARGSKDCRCQGIAAKRDISRHARQNVDSTVWRRWLRATVGSATFHEAFEAKNDGLSTDSWAWEFTTEPAGLVAGDRRLPFRMR